MLRAVKFACTMLHIECKQRIFVWGQVGRPGWNGDKRLSPRMNSKITYGRATTMALRTQPCSIARMPVVPADELMP